ncbi:hypothetical protein [Streptomyces alboflavus]|uniref:hypothetical protein n=1 Tax=Streptomyces alboflavus TaxID=67267 RepID=UPI0013315BB4|nr:hypothetical protein [Streptomyces alboflavus]
MGDRCQLCRHVELPLPDADFTDHISVLTTGPTGVPRATARRRPLAVRQRTHAESG